MVQLEDLRTYALGLPGVTESIKWGHDLCFCVGDKMFLVAGLDAQPVHASFKTDLDQFDRLITLPGYTPAPYLARHHWVMVHDITRIGRADWEAHIDHAYALIFSKLPARIKIKINSKIG